MASPVELINKAMFFLQQRKYGDAEVVLKSILRLHPKHFDALQLMGIICAERGSYVEAEKFLRKAISIDPDLAPCVLNYANVLCKLGRFRDAIDIYNKATKLAPTHAPIYSDRGNALYELTRYEESLLSYDRAISLNAYIADAWVGRGNALYQLKRYDDASVAFDKALTLQPNNANAWLGRGNVFYDLKKYDEAFAAYDKALALKPDLENAWLGRGNLFFDLKRYDEAFAAYDKALALKPDLENAWLGRGNVFFYLKRYDEAFAAYDKALALKPDLAYVEGLRLYSKMLHCDWRNFDEECNKIIGSVRDGKTSSLPFTLLAIPSSADDQLQCARLCIAETYPPSPKPSWRGERYDHDRIRVAYLSPDFRQHATSVASTGMFECHDKSRFEITAISIGPDDKSELRKRLVDSFERFIDAKTYGDDQIAVLIRELEIDIFVDLAGLTRESRTGIFARRSAPIQVNYLGYPGTMGASYIDYLIADQIVIPEDHRDFYAEKIVSLPNSYHVTDDKRFVSDSVFTRKELGLPSAGFVFCCFNNNSKITPHVFDCWMRILKSVDGSVLWLFEDNAKAANNLRRESVARGVNAERLIFGTRMPLADHLARHRLADLCLDTFPYNAHSIATDALWAGLPLLTCRGETFAGRVAASLLTALSLPELITTTLEDYEALAVGLAMHPTMLENIKQKLVQNRLTMPLFNTKLSAKHIETAYTAMYERHQAGLAPDHIAIPN